MKLIEVGENPTSICYNLGMSVKAKDRYYYATFNNMFDRCYNPNSPQYMDYGGRGIRICERWLDKTTVKIDEYIGPQGGRLPIRRKQGYLNFLADVGERPNNFSIDRIDVDGDYSPENCRWASRHTQAANVRNRSEITGVNWVPSRRKWGAWLQVNGKVVLCKRFTDKADAIQARQAAEIQYGI